MLFALLVGCGGQSTTTTMEDESTAEGAASNSATETAAETKGDETRGDETRGDETRGDEVSSIVRMAEARMNASNDLKHIALAVHNQHSVFKQFPDPALRDAENNKLLSWRVAILPYLGESELYEKFHLDESWDSPHNMTLLEQIPEQYVTQEANVETGHTLYLAPINVEPPSPDSPHLAWVADGPSKMRDFLDGTSNTILIVETNQSNSVPWTKPDDLMVDLSNPSEIIGDVFQGGSHMVMADGAVLFITKNIDSEVLKALLTRANKETISPEDFR